MLFSSQLQLKSHQPPQDKVIIISLPRSSTMAALMLDRFGAQGIIIPSLFAMLWILMTKQKSWIAHIWSKYAAWLLQEDPARAKQTCLKHCNSCTAVSCTCPLSVYHMRPWTLLRWEMMKFIADSCAHGEFSLKKIWLAKCPTWVDADFNYGSPDPRISLEKTRTEMDPRGHPDI